MIVIGRFGFKCKNTKSENFFVISSEQIRLFNDINKDNSDDRRQICQIMVDDYLNGLAIHVTPCNFRNFILQKK